MFGMGMTEILVILVIAMIFLGPDKLPEAAAKISKGIREIRKQSRELQDTIETDTQIGGAIRDLKSALRGDDLRRPPVRKVPPADTPAAPPLPAESSAAESPAAAPPAAEPPATEPPATEPAPPVPSESGRSEDASKDSAPDDDPMRLIRPATGTAKREHG